MSLIANPFKLGGPPVALAGSDNQEVHFLSELGEEHFSGWRGWPRKLQLIQANGNQALLVGIPDKTCCQACSSGGKQPWIETWMIWSTIALCAAGNTKARDDGDVCEADGTMLLPRLGGADVAEVASPDGQFPVHGSGEQDESGVTDFS